MIMPLFIKDYLWKQSADTVVVYVPLKGVHHSKADIFTSDKYIKAHYPPFLFEVFLLHPIKRSESKCTLSEGQIVFELIKESDETWETLDDPNITKEQKIDVKKKILEETHEEQQNEHERQIKMKSDLKRFAVRQQIELESQRIEDINTIKKSEREVAICELETWKKNECRAIKDKPANEENIAITNEESPKNKEMLLTKSKGPIKYKKSSVKKTATGTIKTINPVPLPRQPANITVSFSERVFPTPSRESKAPEEEEWLKKQLDARRATGFVAEDLKPEELDPQWLKEKGDTFFKQNNYLGAISAYTHGIKLNDKMAELYINRSAAHFAIGNLHKTIEDCSSAIELLTPPVQANSKARAQCYARRGAALCKLNLPDKGLTEFAAALRLQPDNETLKKDIEGIKNTIYSSTAAME